MKMKQVKDLWHTPTIPAHNYPTWAWSLVSPPRGGDWCDWSLAMGPLSGSGGISRFCLFWYLGNSDLRGSMPMLPPLLKSHCEESTTKIMVQHQVNRYIYMSIYGIKTRETLYPKQMYKSWDKCEISNKKTIHIHMLSTYLHITIKGHIIVWAGSNNIRKKFAAQTRFTTRRK